MISAFDQADEDFTMSVVSPHHLLLASHDSLSIYDFSSLPFEDPSDDWHVHSVQPIWHQRCDIGLGIYRISPLWWSEDGDSSLFDDDHRRPTIFLGERHLHVLQMVDDTVIHRAYGYPFAEDDMNQHVGAGTIGYRRAVWDSTERRDGVESITFRTYTLPRSLDVRLQPSENIASHLLDRGKLGSFAINLDPREHLVNVCLDEGSGRISLLLNDISGGGKRLVIVDTM